MTSGKFESSNPAPRRHCAHSGTRWQPMDNGCRCRPVSRAITSAQWLRASDCFGPAESNGRRHHRPDLHPQPRGFARAGARLAQRRDAPRLPVEILVAANACTDDTVARMRAYQARQDSEVGCRCASSRFRRRASRTRSISAIPLIDTELSPLSTTITASTRTTLSPSSGREDLARGWPVLRSHSARLGRQRAGVGARRRALPDLPAARAPLRPGPEPQTITHGAGPDPGWRQSDRSTRCVEHAGHFSTELGPHGHDLGGGEDSEYVLRAMARGVRCQYAPDILQ